MRDIAAARAAIGVASWTMPVTAGRLFGLGLGGETNAPFLLRLGGARDLVLAAGALEGTHPARNRALRVAIACDALDLAATTLAVRQGRMSKPAATLMAAASAGCMALSARALAS
ncbi:hypothetical protein DSM112329_03561 [Paraconexibacter sp. AEG42_29]|uniref:DUF4267 domain-containing protein n=1 Tax=Paraconexibacter sp. AEG42_29 TaxID=2997339 RepID=A0AAU7AY97_9ACTN